MTTPGLSRQVHNGPKRLTVAQAGARLSRYAFSMISGRVRAKHAAAYLRRLANLLDPREDRR